MAARIRKIKLDDDHKDSIRASQLLNILSNHATSKRGKLSASRIAAARVALPFLRPALQSIEQTVHSADDLMSQEDLDFKFQALIDANPDMLQRVLARRAQANPGVSSELSTDRSAVDAAQHEDNGEVKSA
jgi:hypothetical protein